jgi:hypothetical protein
VPRAFDYASDESSVPSDGLHFDSDSDSVSAVANDDADDNDDETVDNSETTHHSARHQPGEPLHSVVDSNMAAHAHSFQDYDYSSSNNSMRASSATKLSQQLHVQNMSEVPVEEIHVPGRLHQDTPPSDLPADTGIGSTNEQVVIAAWKTVFSTATRPGTAALPDTTNDPDSDQPPRLRQSRINTIVKKDNVPYGDLLRNKTPGFQRLHHINPNGISAHRDFSDLCEMLHSFHAIEVDGLGLSEINLELLKPEVRKRCEDLWHDFFGTSILVGFTSSLRAQRAYKPGGTFTSIMHSLYGRYQTSGSDPHGLGRWSYIQVCSKDGKSLVMITACRVCNENISTSGASTACHQQWHLLRLAGQLKPNPPKQFITDLIQEIKRWQLAGADIILGGDFNERLGNTQDGIARLVTQSGLVDVHTSNHGLQAEPNTYSRGTKRLHYVFASPRILDYVDIFGTEPFHPVTHTDHRGLFVDLDLQGLLGGEMASMLPPRLRDVSSCTAEPDQCIFALHKHLTDNSVFTKLVGVIRAACAYHCVPADLVKYINKSDHRITQGMLLAELRCCRKPKPAWSAALAAAGTVVRFWKIRITGLQTGWNVSLELFTIATALRWDHTPLDSTLEQANVGLKAAIKGLHKCRTRAAELRSNFIDERIKAAALAEDTTVEKMLKKLKHGEA